MNVFSTSVAERTRLQQRLFAQGFDGSNSGSCCESSRDQYPKRSREMGHSNKASKTTTQYGRPKDPSSKAKYKKFDKIYESSDGKSKKEEIDAEECHVSLEEDDEIKEIDNIEFMKSVIKSNGYCSAISLKKETHSYIICSSDDSDSDYTFVVVEEEEIEGDAKKVEDCYFEVDKEKAIQHQESMKGRRKDDSGCVDAIVDSITRKESDHGKEDDGCLPLQFRFEDSEDESSGNKEDDSDVEGLFQEMDFELECEEIGCYKTPMDQILEKDDYNYCDEYDIDKNHLNCCQRAEHGGIYFEEQIGMRCRACGAVLLESRYVIPKLANYAPHKSNGSYLLDEQLLPTSENLYFSGSNYDSLDVRKQTEGTVWELIPTNIREHLYPHQQDGFKFLWENLAGTIKLSNLKKLDPPHGGGCIISHAPGTGKTLLTIAFIESFLKKFPRCCPVIVAPASMLLTWEAEFNKWQVGFPFINLNNSDLLRNQMTNCGSRLNKDLIRAMKISSWIDCGNVLGLSYHLYEKLAGNTKNTNLEKLGKVLLDMPGLVVLDEGHTPRNQNSKIWNILLQLTTKNRVVLSGTPFQNNFKELFNTLRLVRPETAIDILNNKTFADMIHQKNRKKSEDIKKLNEIISPFVHVHKGHILENKLPGLKQSVILLNPPPLQKSFIENMEFSSKTFEYDHKVALVSVHPSLILHCWLSEKEEKSMNKQELENVRLHPKIGVKTRFVMELIRLSVSLHEKVLIFSQYIQPLELIKDQIAHGFGWNVGREVMVIKGRIHQKIRQTMIIDFNDPNSEVKVLLASTKCCSEGIHLYGASRVVLLDIVWNPSVERQAISRAYRLGQKKVVYTYHLMVAGTTEEEKYDRQVEKGRLAEMVFSSSAMDGEKMKNKVNVHVMELSDKILQQMVDHQELKDIFKRISYPENRTTV